MSEVQAGQVQVHHTHARTIGALILATIHLLLVQP